MAFLLDTNILIALRDGEEDVTAKLADLDGAVLMSIISRVELEGGVYRDLQHARLRRERMDVIFAAIPAPVFDAQCATAYAAILAAAGYSRRKLLDRMIGAQAIVHRATLVTRNPVDFSDIPGLTLLVW